MFRLDHMTNLADVVILNQGQFGVHSLSQSWVHLAISEDIFGWHTQVQGGATGTNG